MSNRYESGSPVTCSGEEVTILFYSGLCFHVYLFYYKLP